MKYRLSTLFEEKYDFFSNEGRDISLPPLSDLLPPTRLMKLSPTREEINPGTKQEIA